MSVMRTGLMCSTFYCGEPAPHNGLEYVLQRFYSLMRLLYGGIPETHQRKTDGFCPCGQGLNYAEVKG